MIVVVGSSVSVFGSPAHDDHRQVVALGAAAQLGLAHHRRRGLEDRRAGQRAGDLFLWIHAPQAVGAQHDQVAVAQRRAARQVDHRIDEPAQAAEDLVAVGMIEHLVRADDSLVEQVLDLGVVLGLADQPALAEEVEPRVADVRPVRVVRLHDAGYAGRARRLQHRELVGVGAERLVCAQHRVLQELERVLERRLRLLLEALDEQPHGDLRRDLAAGVAAHAVGDHQQQRVAAVGVGEPVLVDLALALAAFLEDREAHGPSPYITSLNSFFFSVSRKVSLRLRGGMSRIAFCSANTLCGRSSGSSRRHQSITSSRLSE